MKSDYTIVHDRGFVPKVSFVCIFCVLLVQQAWFHGRGIQLEWTPVKDLSQVKKREILLVTGNVY